eukprot:746846-Hanusia_phi.AAC.2
MSQTFKVPRLGAVEGNGGGAASRDGRRVCGAGGAGEELTGPPPPRTNLPPPQRGSRYRPPRCPEVPASPGDELQWFGDGCDPSWGDGGGMGAAEEGRESGGREEPAEGQGAEEQAPCHHLQQPRMFLQAGSPVDKVAR